jgi:hypothetical protein
VQPVAQRGAQLQPFAGEREQLHAAVVIGRPSLDEAAVLQAVDDAGDVGVVAPEDAGELAHRDRLVRLERLERAELRR